MVKSQPIETIVIVDSEEDEKDKKEGDEEVESDFEEDEIIQKALTPVSKVDTVIKKNTPVEIVPK